MDFLLIDNNIQDPMLSFFHPDYLSSFFFLAIILIVKKKKKPLKYVRWGV